MRKLHYYDNVHQRRRKQHHHHQLIDSSNKRDYCGEDKRRNRCFKEIGAVLSKYDWNNSGDANNDDHDENYIDYKNQQRQQKLLIKPTKCAKMSEENGMIKNGNLNGVGIATSISQNLTNFSSFTISPSANVTTTPTTTAPSSTIPATFTTTSSTTSITTTTTTTTTTSNLIRASLANSISNSNSNLVRVNNDSTANTANGHIGGGGGVGCTGGGGDTSNSDFGEHKPTNINNNGSVAAHPNVLGGRLQFFKDGKFILELARKEGKEGDRGGWISVPRKTYWPPAVPSSNNNSVNHNKNESSTSLSFSDDNSSIQSSPWQRDHCWKQPSPRRNISKELCMYYYRPTAIVLHAKCFSISKLKRRRPHDTKLSANQQIEYAKRTILMASKSMNIADETNDEKVKDAGNIEDETSIDAVDSGDSSAKQNVLNADEIKSAASTRATSNVCESDENAMAIDEPSSIQSTVDEISAKVEKLPIKQKRLKRPELRSILQKLIDKLAEQPQNVVGMQTGPGAGALLSGNGTSRTNDLGYYQQHVSPRKRILREFEKVSLEDSANTSMTKRSRSKGCNSSASDGSRTANGNRNANVTDGTPKTTQSSTLYPISQGNITPVASRPISSYSITSLLGHNSSSGNSNNNSNPKVDNSQRTSPKSPQQTSTSRISKKKSPINGSASIGSPMGLTSSSFGSHRSPMNSPVNYGGRSTRSPDLNSPSPDHHHHSIRNHAQRYAYGGASMSISSPTSGFHPYLPTSRASPLSGNAGALSPNTLERYRSNYRTAASPSGTSSSSISGPSHGYVSTNGSPNAHMMRYSPSTFGSNAQTSPPHQKSAPYNINSLLPQASDTSNGNTVCRNISISQNYSPNAKTREQSPPSRTTKMSATTTSTTANSTANNCNNNTPTRTIPKKTASLRHPFGSLSPNAAASSHVPHEAKTTEKRARSPEQLHKQQQRCSAAELEQHQTYLAATSLHSRNAASSPPLPLPVPPPSSAHANSIHPFYLPYVPPTHANANVSQSMAAMAAAAYLNPLYYHPMTYPNPYRPQFWMPYPPAPMSPRTAAASLLQYSPNGSPSTSARSFAMDERERHSEENERNMSARTISNSSNSTAAPPSLITSNSMSSSSWMGSHHSASASPPKTAFQRHHQATRSSGEFESFQAIRDEQNSDVPLNLSKH